MSGVPVLAKVPNDPSFSNQQIAWEQISLPAAWDKTTGSNQVVVAVIDSGIDTWHQDLSANIWHNLKEIPGNGVDDDGNGFIDDYDGWNFVENNNDVRTSVFETATSNADAVRHGTVIAGLVGAVGDNGQSGVGVNWQVRLMALRGIDNVGDGSELDIARAVDYATNNGADIITMSFVGDTPAPRLKAALRRAYERGLVIVAAAGNNRAIGKGDLADFPQYPACSDLGESANWIITVTSVDSADRLSSFANYGRCIDLVAPGQSLYSTERYAPQFGYAIEFGGPWNGTSFAAPIVAGAAALIKGVRPDWKAPEIIANLLATADSVAERNPGLVAQLGAGRLNISAAVSRALSSKPARGGLSTMYYTQGNALWQLALSDGATKFISRINGANITGLAAGLAANGQELVALLFKRGSKSYVRLVGSDGALRQEFFVGEEIKTGKQSNAFIKVRFLAAAPGEEPQVIVEQKKSATNTSVFNVFSLAGITAGTSSAITGVQAWDTLPNSKFITAELAKGVVTLSEWSVKGNMLRSLALARGVSAVDDLRVGGLFEASGTQAAVLFRQNKQIKLAVADMPTESVLVKNIAPSSTAPWKLRLGDLTSDGVLEVLAFPATGGLRPVTDARGRMQKNLSVPSFVGPTE